MKTIYKYTLDVRDVTEVAAPYGARFLPYVEMVPGAVEFERKVWVWAEIDDAQPPRRHRLRIHGTGHPIPDGERYIGTVRDGIFIWHVYEVPS